MHRAALVVPLVLTLAAWGCGGEPFAAPGDPQPNSAAGSGGNSGSAGIPCEVDAVLSAHCRSCHADPPRYGAPMPLVSLADIVAPAKSDPELTVADLIPARIDDPDAPMPPSGDLPEADRNVLLDWLAAAAPPYEGPDCGTEPPPPPPEVGPDALDCEVTHTFVAHAVGANDAPYQVPEMGAENLYQCFTFKSPFDGVTQGTAWAPIVDDERVLHHWILYRTKTPQPEGGVMPCQMPGDAQFVAGWAPGGLNYAMPDDVGLELGGPDDYFILQIHYHNVAHYDDALDASGVALCTTDTPRTHMAGIFTLGSVVINIPPYAKGYQTSGLCASWMTNYLPEPVNVIASFPHMHELGRQIRTEIMRGSNNGPLETLIEVDPWQFEDQRFYPHEPAVVIHPGDAIRTTCTYDNPYSYNVTMGEKTEDEMCFNFVMLYPIDIFGESRQCGLF